MLKGYISFRIMNDNDNNSIKTPLCTYPAGNNSFGTCHKNEKSRHSGGSFVAGKGSFKPMA